MSNKKNINNRNDKKNDRSAASYDDPMSLGKNNKQQGYKLSDSEKAALLEVAKNDYNAKPGQKEATSEIKDIYNQSGRYKQIVKNAEDNPGFGNEYIKKQSKPRVIDVNEAFSENENIEVKKTDRSEEVEDLANRITEVKPAVEQTKAKPEVIRPAAVQALADRKPSKVQSVVEQPKKFEVVSRSAALQKLAAQKPTPDNVNDKVSSKPVSKWEQKRLEQQQLFAKIIEEDRSNALDRNGAKSPSSIIDSPEASPRGSSVRDLKSRFEKKLPGH